MVVRCRAALRGGHRLRRCGGGILDRCGDHGGDDGGESGGRGNRGSGDVHGGRILSARCVGGRSAWLLALERPTWGGVPGYRTRHILAQRRDEGKSIRPTFLRFGLVPCGVGGSCELAGQLLGVRRDHGIAVDETYPIG